MSLLVYKIYLKGFLVDVNKFPYNCSLYIYQIAFN